MPKKQLFEFKTYELLHGANHAKEQQLWALYSVYKKEYKIHIHKYWQAFLHNKFIKFSHLGSTKHITTQLNASYLQIVLSQACATLNQYIAAIEQKFNLFISNSSIKDKEILHQLRTINSTHSWLNKNNYYYPVYQHTVIDDFGNEIKTKVISSVMNDYGFNYTVKRKTVISKDIIRLSKKIFFNIIDKQRVRFPYLEKPRLILDSRVMNFELSNNTQFEAWLSISTLETGRKIKIPIQKHDYFNQAFGEIGKTIEINFTELPYKVVKPQYKIACNYSTLNNLKKTQAEYNKISRPKKRYMDIETYTSNLLKYEKYKSRVEEIKDIYMTDKFIRVLVNKKTPVIENKQLTIPNKVNNNEHEVAFDLGLCVLMATSDGELYGHNWLDKLKEYDLKITELGSNRQSIGLKTRSPRYDNLIKQAKGFIKSEINRILNHYFKFKKDLGLNIKTVVLEKLMFNNPDLSKKLNRIIKNFGQGIFNTKLESLSKEYGFKVVKLNPAYSSQQCRKCDFIDSNNRLQRGLFKCLCCGFKEHADLHGARVLLKRFKEDKFAGVRGETVSKSSTLSELKKIFAGSLKTLISHGYVTRRKLLELLRKSNYFQDIFEHKIKTGEGLWLTPMNARKAESNPLCKIEKNTGVEIKKINLLLCNNNIFLNYFSTRYSE